MCKCLVCTRETYNERVYSPACAAASALATPAIVCVVADSVGMAFTPCITHVIRRQNPSMRVAFGLRIPSSFIPLLLCACQVAIIPNDIQISAPNDLFVGRKRL